MRIRNLSESDVRRRLDAFTTLELLGGLAVIGVLAVMLMGPTINTINETKALNAVGAWQSLLTAATNHFNAYGSFLVCSNSTRPATSAQLANWDTGVLIPEGFMDHPFQIKIGLSSVVQVSTAPNSDAGRGYLLNGVYNCTNNMQTVVEIVVTGVNKQNAFDISQIVDGNTLTPTNVGGVDTLGKVIYDGSNVMHMYVTGI